MRNPQRIRQYFRQHRIASIATGHVIVATILGLVLLGNAFGSTLFGASAQTPCSNNDRTYVVISGDTLATIATRYGTTWQNLVSYNKISNSNTIYIAQHICIPGKGSAASNGTMGGGLTAVRGVSNPFPYGQCTWYANQRFFQMHSAYVPWQTNANAWQWTARAYDYHWHVSGSPSVGAIVDLQPGVEGAYQLGHVAIVERVLSNGHVIASNMNWGAFYWQVTNVEFTPGYGVTFINI